MRRVKILSTVSISILLALTLSACGKKKASTASSTSASSTSTTVDAGLTKFDDGKLQITLPDGWTNYDLKDPAAASKINDVLNSGAGALTNDAQKNAVESAKSLISQGGLLFSFDAPKNGLADNINIISKDQVGAGQLSAALMKSSVSSEFSNLGGTLGTIDDTTVNGVKAVRATVTLPIQVSGSTVTVHDVQYYYLDNDTLYIFTGTAGTERDSDFDAVAKSFKIL